VATLKLALDLLDKLVQENPQVASFRDTLATGHRQVGIACREAGWFEEGVRHCRAAVTIGEKLHRADPTSTALRRGLAKSYFDLGSLHMKQKQEAPAVSSFLQAREQFRFLAVSNPSLVEDHRSLAMALNNLAILQQKSHPPEALAAVNEAIEQGKETLRQAPGVLGYREGLNNSYRLAASLEREAGRYVESAAAVLARKDLLPNDANQLYQCARDLALAADPPTSRQNSPFDAEEARRNEWRGLAVQLLQQAIDKGLADWNKRSQDEAWNALRRREDFRRLVDLPNKTSERGLPGHAGVGRFTSP
jgi:hypothetical protein